MREDVFSRANMTISQACRLPRQLCCVYVYGLSHRSSVNSSFDKVVILLSILITNFVFLFGMCISLTNYKKYSFFLINKARKEKIICTLLISRERGREL